MNINFFEMVAVKAGFVAFALALGLAACGDGGSTNGPSNNHEDTNISSVFPSSSSSVIPGTDPGSSSSVASSSSAKSSSSVASSSSEKSSSSVASSSSMKAAWAYLNPDIDYGEFTDERDGQVYKTVKICDKNDENCQTWMAENLNYDPGDVSDMGDYAWSGCYENESANCSKYGRLYTWEVAMDKAGCGYGNYCENKYEGTQGVCPEGWHLPSVDEWDALFTAVGGFRTAGVKLKSVEGWEKSFSASTTGTDVYGFSALPAGEGYYDGGFDLVGRSAYFCSSTEDENLGGSRHAYYKALRYYSEGAHLDEEHKNYARSVRCLKDSF